MNRQPGFNHPLLKDHTIQLKPSSLLMEMDVENPFISSISEAQLPSYCRMPYRNHPSTTQQETRLSQFRIPMQSAPVNKKRKQG
ncbi:Os05g0333150 [Oryza sativa Japonica Group]|uniref:Os05g0333150 protein n=1 Tax=Oryza sativa subsp. japonica TaxID=39947 RepID=A0A0N7KKK1_ORYSJ|nr:Os05g0333150 [Oryza sativa Japonica Group]